MRKAVSVLLATVLSAGVVSIPALTQRPADPKPVDPVQHSIELSGIDEQAFKDPHALDPIPISLTETGSAGEQPDEGELAAITQRISTDEFYVTGVTWDAADSEDVTQVAARVLEDGTWSPWTQLPVSETPDLELAQDAQLMADLRHGSEPLTTIAARGIQVRVFTQSGRLPAASRIELINPGTSQADEWVTQPSSGAIAQASDSRDVLKPKVITREQWGANEKLGGAWNTVSNEVKSIYIHHTAGVNNYKESQGPALVRGIYSYHTQALRWADIGYQFLVDKYGNIYQGRRTATVDSPIGAQTGGYNTSTIGVSALGNYETAQPTSALIEALTQVVAWKSYEYGIDPLGKTKLVTGSSSKSTTRARAGTTVTVNTIQGHRDTNYTACPGKYLYAKLPTLRTNVAERLNEAAVNYGTYTDSLTAPKRVTPAKKAAPVQWKATAKYAWKPVKGASSYQVLVQTSSSNRSGGPSNTTWSLYTSTKATSAKVSISKGGTRVVGVRALDSAGRRGPIRVLTTSSRPLSAATIKAPAKQWKVDKKKKYAGNKAYVAKKKGAVVNLGSVTKARYVALRAVRGPKAGTIRVSVGSWSKLVNLAAKKNNPTAIVVVDLEKKRTGTMHVTAVSKRVKISKIGIGFKKRANPPVRVVGPSPVDPVVATTISSVYAADRTVTWPKVSQADSYIVLTRTINPTDKSYGLWRKTTTTSLSANISLNAGQSAQIAVLPQRDKAYQAAGSTPVAARAIDLGSVDLDSGWQIVPSSGTPARILTTSGSTQAVATLPSVKNLAGLQLGVATGSRQGVIIIQAGAKQLARVDLSTYATSSGSVINIPFTGATDEVVSISALSGNPVTIASIGYLRN